MKDFLFNYGWFILLIVAFTVYVYRYYNTKGKEKTNILLRETAFKLMLVAEKKFGKGEGEFKFDWVIENLYSVMPSSFKFMFQREYVVKVVQNVYDELKDYLDDGEVNGSIK